MNRPNNDPGAAFARIAQVAVADAVYHFDKLFSYRVPERLAEQAQKGCRVLVPFGAGNGKRQGVILETAPCGEEQGLKAIEAVLDKAPLLNDEMLSLARWVKETTFCTQYEALRLMLPAGVNLRFVDTYAPVEGAGGEEALIPPEREALAALRESGPLTREKLAARLRATKEACGVWLQRLQEMGLIVAQKDAVRRIGDASVKMVRLMQEQPEGIKLSPRQKEVAALLEAAGAASVKEVCYFTGVTAAVVNALVKKGAAEFFDEPVYRDPYEGAVRTRSAGDIALTPRQREALEGLHARLSEGGVALLYGVTGSGKTSVFLKLIDQVVTAGREVILMVPEIALTPQLISLFHSCFGKQVAVFHSALSLGQRMDEWKRVKNGEAKIAIGTRSAIFAPFEHLGLVVMDEEQEYTYKSEASPRYHARDVARFRCAYHHALLVLSSATPAVESYYAAQSGRYSLHTLPERYGGASLPHIRVVDMAAEQAAGNTGAFSGALTEELRRNLEQKKQSIVLLNRRGYHTFASCASCGEVLACPHCSISMTYHAANRRLMCHYCGSSMPVPPVCPACGQPHLRFAGAGTQKAEEELLALLPGARVLRMDTDTTMARFAHEKKLSRFAHGEYDVMIGTQMVAKGLDFPNVTLVGVLSADQALYGDDFRSYERAFSLLTQVVGRSGRGREEGMAVIQTLTPENPIIRLAASQDYDAFYRKEIEIRKACLYPPFADLCVVGFVGSKEERVRAASLAFLEQFKALASAEYQGLPLRVIGPAQAAVARMGGKYRYKLLIKCKNGARFRALLARLLQEYGRQRAFSDVTAFADMNPESIM